MENPSDRDAPKRSFYGIGLLFFCLGIHFCVSMIGWGNCILDFHGFRQSQTAISTYYLAKNGLSLAYETPVLGAPWSIPFEFPLFQALVAIIHQKTGYPLDQTGRAVSLFFFYASLVPLFFIVLRTSRSSLCAYLTVSFTLICPLYLFWPRTFMMESVALFFTLSYLMCVIVGLETTRGRWIMAGAIAGSMAGLVKPTTFFIGLAGAGLASLGAWNTYAKDRTNFTWRHIGYLAMVLVFCAVLPLLSVLIWTAYADQLKSLNPIGSLLTSENLRNWNYGTMAQKFQIGTWVSMFSTRFLPYVFGANLQNYLGAGRAISILVLAMVILSGRKRLYVTYFVLLFFLGPLVFTNLYFIHEYYWYANGVYFIAALGLSVGNLAEKRSLEKPVKLLLIPLLSGVMILGYVQHLYPLQVRNSQPELREVAEMVKSMTSDDGVVFIRGLNWDSSFPYYAQRRALMIPYRVASEEKVSSALERTGISNFQALVIGPRNGPEQVSRLYLDERFCVSQAERIGMRNSKVIDKHGFRVFFRDGLARDPADSDRRSKNMFRGDEPSLENSCLSIVDDQGESMLQGGPDGKRFVISSQGFGGHLERLAIQNDKVLVEGWGVDLTHSVGPSGFAFFIGQEYLGFARPISRPDVGRHFGKREMDRSGFRVELPVDALKGKAFGSFRVLVLAESGFAWDIPTLNANRDGGKTLWKPQE